MDLRSMESFITLCRYRNYTHAAEHLFISQSALSKRISNVEVELGFPLVDRDSPNFRLTPMGMGFLQECENVFRAYAKMEQRVNRLRTGEVRPLTVYLRHLPTELIASCVTEMSRLYPEIEFTFKNYTADTDLAKLLLQGAADVVLGIREDFEKYQGITSRVFGPLQHGVLVGADHPFFNKSSILTTDLLNYKFCLFYNKPNSRYIHPIESFLKDRGFDTRNILLAPDRKIMLYYVATGKYWGYSSMNLYLNAGIPGLVKCVPWSDCSIMDGDLSVAYRNSDPLAMRFSDILMNCANHRLT